MAEFTDFSTQNPRQTQHTIGPTGIQTRQIADLAVTNAKISSLTFDKAVGGTLTLGGANNVSGLFSLRDASNAEIISMNNTGITIYNGNITIKDSTNTSILDATGLISTANFAIGSVYTVAASTTSSTSYVDVPGSTLPQFTLSRTTRFQVNADAYGVNDALNTAGAVIIMQVQDNGSVVYSWVVTGVFANATPISAYAGTSKIISFAAGNHNLKLVYKTSGSGTAYLFAFDLSYVQLGV